LPPRPLDSTPLADGFHLPAEWEPQERCYMIWPERTDNWRLGARPAQAAFTSVAAAVARSEPVTMLVSARQWEHARAVG
jgi:agmatine deiminase